MAFNKFEAVETEEEPSGSAHRRAMILKYGWVITAIYTAFGFVMIGYFILR